MRERGRAAPRPREGKRERPGSRRRCVVVGREGGRRRRGIDGAKRGAGVESEGGGDGRGVEGREGKARRAGVRAAVVLKANPESHRVPSLMPPALDPSLRASFVSRRHLRERGNKGLEAREERQSRSPRRRRSDVGSFPPLLLLKASVCAPLPPISLVQSSPDELPPRDSAVAVPPLSAAITRHLERVRPRRHRWMKKGGSDQECGTREKGETRKRRELLQGRSSA